LNKYLIGLLIILGISLVPQSDVNFQQNAKIQDESSVTTIDMRVDPGTG